MVSDIEIRLRSWLRQRGLTRYLRPHQHLYRRYQSMVYRRRRPNMTTLSAGGLSAQGLVGSEEEYLTLVTKKEDERFMVRLAEWLPRGGCFWDVGANIGFYSLLASRAVGAEGQVICFEPEPGARARLEQNLEANAVHWARIMPIALAAKAGSAQMESQEHASSGGHRLLDATEARTASSRVVTVEMATGDSLLPEIPAPNAVKIDVEGFELDVIEGMSETLRLPGCRALLCEVHFGLLENRGIPFAAREIEERVRGAGFARFDWPDRSHLFATKA